MSHRDRLDRMVHCTKALAIGWIERQTTIAQLNDVVSIHGAMRCSVGASMTVAIDGFTSAASTVQDQDPPSLELRRVVDWIDKLWW